MSKIVKVPLKSVVEFFCDCPYCGKEYADMTTWEDNEGKIISCECGNKFEMTEPEGSIY